MVAKARRVNEVWQYDILPQGHLQSYKIYSARRGWGRVEGGHCIQRHSLDLFYPWRIVIEATVQNIRYYGTTSYALGCSVLHWITAVVKTPTALSWRDRDFLGYCSPAISISTACYSCHVNSRWRCRPSKLSPHIFMPTFDKEMYLFGRLDAKYTSMLQELRPDPDTIQWHRIIATIARTNICEELYNVGRYEDELLVECAMEVLQYAICSLIPFNCMLRQFNVATIVV